MLKSFDSFAAKFVLCRAQNDTSAVTKQQNQNLSANESNILEMIQFLQKYEFGSRRYSLVFLQVPEGISSTVRVQACGVDVQCSTDIHQWLKHFIDGLADKIRPMYVWGCQNVKLKSGRTCLFNTLKVLICFYFYKALKATHRVCSTARVQTCGVDVGLALVEVIKSSLV